MQEVAQHPGIVLGSTPGHVTVQIVTHSACGACSAHAHCGFAESGQREIVVDTPAWSSYRAGQKVTVSVSESLGFLAVVWAYLLPAVLLLACVITLLCLMSSEPLAVLITLAVIALYYLMLYHYRDRLQRRFTFGIAPAEE